MAYVLRADYFAVERSLYHVAVYVYCMDSVAVDHTVCHNYSVYLAHMHCCCCAQSVHVGNAGCLSYSAVVDQFVPTADVRVSSILFCCGAVCACRGYAYGTNTVAVESFIYLPMLLPWGTICI